MFADKRRLAFASPLILVIASLAGSMTACNSSGSGSTGTTTSGTGSGTTTSCGNAQVVSHALARNIGSYLETGQSGLKKLAGHIPRWMKLKICRLQ
jgi:hypothetical protein